MTVGVLFLRTGALVAIPLDDFLTMSADELTDTIVEFVKTPTATLVRCRRRTREDSDA